MTAPPDACPTCGARAEPDQEYCLECGSRLVALRRFSAVGRAWERRLGRYPGDWIWASLLLLLVAAGSATAGIVAARDTETANGAKTIVATSPVVTAPPAPPAAPTATTRATGPLPRPRPQPKASEPIAWPARDGFTVVLASIPARGTGRADAEARAKDALRRGLRDVGILTSDRFASLHPGYLVVFAGVYDTLDEAQTAARRALSRFPNAYAREITR
ncbi:MAG TPA: zinc ribbon domain-containing protein [Gaiellaceae bacterium]|nr:zinc ribbon domain-containing protein [Gaiellaceae bacterium]